MRRHKKGGRSFTSLFMILLILVIAAIALLLVKPEMLGSLIEKKSEQPIEATTIVKVGEAAPDFTVELSDGSSVTLSELKGKVVLLNFWATWCPPCREELTHVQTDIIDRFADKPFVMLPVSRGENHEVVNAFIAEKGYAFKVGYDPEQAIYNKYATNYIPRNFIIDADGTIAFIGIGYDPEEFAEMIKVLDEKINNITK